MGLKWVAFSHLHLMSGRAKTTETSESSQPMKASRLFLPQGFFLNGISSGIRDIRKRDIALI
ncbi:MAG: hypothetical protein ACETVT_05180, partial [bacterium]